MSEAGKAGDGPAHQACKDGQGTCSPLPLEIWQRIADMCSSRDWLPGAGCASKLLSSVQLGRLIVARVDCTTGKLHCLHSDWRGPLRWLGARWHAAHEATLCLAVGRHRSPVHEPLRDLALADALRTAGASPGGRVRAPGRMRALLLRLEGGPDMSHVHCLGDLAVLERPLAKLVQAALACAPDTLERFSSTAPGRAPLLPCLPNLAHLTLHLTNPARVARWLGTWATGRGSFFPALQSLVLLGSGHSGEALGMLELGSYTSLRAVYLDGLTPYSLALPVGCALHWIAPCSTQELTKPLSCHRSELYRHLCSFSNLRVDCPSSLFWPHVPNQVPVCLWLRSFTLKSASKDVLFGFSFGTAAQPVSLAPLPALERFMMNSDVAVFLQVPLHIRPWTFCVTSTSSLGLAFEAPAGFAAGLKDLGLQSDDMQGPGMVQLLAELGTRGLPVVSRLQGRDMPQGRCVVIRGCRFDCEAGKRACQCYMCLDCLVERASQHFPDAPAPL